MNPQLSIIIPAHNEEKYLKKTLESIAEQQHKDIETIVVANGCTDKTAQVALDSGAKVISLKEANVCWARNVGATHAKAPLLLFLDADTLLPQDGLHVLLDHFQPEHAVATTQIMADKRGFRYTILTQFKNFYLQSGLYEGCSGALLCRKQEFHQAGGYDPKKTISEHRDLILRLKVKGKHTCAPTIVTTSMRRLEEWGMLKTIKFWLFQRKEEAYERVR